ncbi:AAA family ATPase [Nocardia sp. NPDC058114]|uniref:AAA family ATPase n=1 Tax=Nocardia sp. NPDC058114 TaxID=3346346 RepID=UPI0036DB8804
MKLTTLLGRRAEREAVEKLLEAARVANSGTIILRGQPGIGKTALLDYAREAGSPVFRVVGCVGVESEALFAFAALHQLCAPLLDEAKRLPESQRVAIDVAFGSRSGPAPDMFLVGLATLNLLTDAAEAAPLLCLIDDAQWLDPASAQVLAFVSRRIAHERVAMMFASRELETDGPHPVTADAVELRLEGLRDADSRSLLMRGAHAPVDEKVRDRILAEARGNPLALLEFPRRARLTELAGGFESPGALNVPRRIEEGFRRRSAGLSEDAQLLLLLAAADATGDAVLLWRAAEELGITPAAVEPAQETGLIEVDTRVRFRHPLVRSAVYRSATPETRRRAHRALAAATDPHTDPDRRAWHHASGVVGASEDAAAELERSAERTRARGGVAAAAAFLQRATELTPEPAVRARRALAAAHAKHDAGASAAAEELLTVAELGPLDELQRARVDLLRARITFHLTQSNDVPAMLLEAARNLTVLDPALARETYLHAIDAALVVDASSVAEVAGVARSAPPPPGEPSPPDLLLDALVATFAIGYAAGALPVRRAMEAFRDRGFDGEATGEMGSRRWLWLATRTAAAFFDDDIGITLADRNVRLAREAGALTTLPLSLVALSSALVLTGDLSRAAEVAAEEAAITTATDAVPLLYGQLYVAAWGGHELDTRRLFKASVANAGERLSEAATAHYALAVLFNGLGQYGAARDAAAWSNEMGELVNSSLTLPELVEASVRANDPDGASAAADELSTRAAASGTAWALGLAARSRALVTTDPTAETCYQEAIRHLQNSRMKGHLARTHLVYGEWLRREGRRQSAREQLRTAHEMLTDMRADAFAARAARELRATGQHPRNRSTEPGTELTAHEQLVARLVATGSTSREVATQLFLSPRTIDAHLRNIYRKLGISSRKQLRDLLNP